MGMAAGCARGPPWRNPSLGGGPQPPPGPGGVDCARRPGILGSGRWRYHLPMGLDRASGAPGCSPPPGAWPVTHSGEGGGAASGGLFGGLGPDGLPQGVPEGGTARGLWGRRPRPHPRPLPRSATRPRRSSVGVTGGRAGQQKLQTHLRQSGMIASGGQWGLGLTARSRAFLNDRGGGGGPASHLEKGLGLEKGSWLTPPTPPIGSGLAQAKISEQKFIGTTQKKLQKSAPLAQISHFSSLPSHLGLAFVGIAVKKWKQ